jgi:hypothetical protein
MTDVQVDDGTGWLDLLPAGVGDDAYRADVRAEARSAARHVQVAKIVADLEARVSAGLADPSVDPSMLVGPATELASARTIQSVLPAVVPVAQGRHNAVAVQLPRPRRGALPYPPSWCGELVHHQRMHAVAGDVPPPAGPLDFEAIEAYERVSAEAATQWATLNYLDEGPRGQMSNYVTSWSAATKHDGWAALHGHITELVDLVARADAARPVTDGACAYGHHASWRLQPPAKDPTRTGSETPWTFKAAVRDGVLVQVTP